MTVDAATGQQAAERKRLEALVEKIMPVARAADAIARRSVGKVAAVAVMGALAATWLSYACVATFSWGLAAALTMLIVLALPSLVLWKLHATLKATVGLPARVADAIDRLFGKYAEYRQLHAERASAPTPLEKPRFRQLWRTARSVFDLKALGDEGQELLTTLGGAIVMTNPVFAAVLFISMAIAMSIICVAAIVALTFVF